MATRQSTVDVWLDQLASAGQLTTRKMFGEYCLYLAGVPVALICNDQLYIKPTQAGWALGPEASPEPPFPGIGPYLLIPAELAERHDQRETLCQLLQATYDELSQPRPRRRRSVAPSQG